MINFVFSLLFVAVAVRGAEECVPGTTLTEVALKPPTEPLADAMGYAASVSVPANNAALLAVGSAFAGADKTGVVHVYRRDTDTKAWTLLDTIVPPSTQAYQRFGACTAFDATGAWLLVTVWGDNGDDKSTLGALNENTYELGGAYVYAWDADAKRYVERALLKPLFTAYHMYAGMSACAMSSDALHVAIGADREEGDATSTAATPNRNARCAGTVFTYSRATTDDNTWPERAYIKAVDAQAYHYFGRSVAFSYDTTALAIGVIGHRDPVLQTWNAGRVDVYARNGVGWKTNAPVANASLPGSPAGSQSSLGTAVLLNADGSLLVAGAPAYNELAWPYYNRSVGAAVVFKRNGAVYDAQAVVMAPNKRASSLYGYALAAPPSLSHVYVGSAHERGDATSAMGAYNEKGWNVGAVYEYRDSSAGGDGSEWTLDAYYKNSASADDDAFGRDLAVDATRSTLAVAAPYEGSEWTGEYAGATRVSRIGLSGACSGAALVYDAQCPTDPTAYEPLCTYTLEAATSLPNLYTRAWRNFIVEFAVDGVRVAQYSLRTALAETVQRSVPAGHVELRVASTDYSTPARASLRVLDDNAGGTEVYAAAVGDLADVVAGQVLAEFDCA